MLPSPRTPCHLSAFIRSVRRYAFFWSVSPFVFVINRICRLIVKRKGMEVSVSTRHQPALVSMSF